MPARTLNDFFAGFFYAGIRAMQEVRMVMKYKGQGNGGVKVIKVEGGRERKGGNRPPRSCLFEMENVES